MVSALKLLPRVRNFLVFFWLVALWLIDSLIDYLFVRCIITVAGFGPASLSEIDFVVAAATVASVGGAGHSGICETTIRLGSGKDF